VPAAEEVMADLEPRIIMAIVGAGLTAGGVALAANYKGSAAWHARRSVASVRWLDKPLRNIPPWKQILSEPLEDRIARQAVLTRVIGAAFACTGVLLFIAACVAANITMP
jgi:hypothetical protein